MESAESVSDIISELEVIIAKKQYNEIHLIMGTYGNMEFPNIKYTAKFIEYLYHKFTSQKKATHAYYFENCDECIFCPSCESDVNVKLWSNVIQKATIIKNNQNVAICKACSLIWLHPDDIRRENALNYKEYMQSLGLKGLWQELKDVDIL